MNLNQIHNVFFIGIGGIGMSALARYFKTIGKNVSGYDKTPSMLTDELIESGIAIHFEDRIDLIPKDYYTENTLVIITPAVPVTHSQWNFFLEREYQVKKRAEVLGIITKDTFCFAVAGTHGKTTTSSILGHILFESGADVTAFVGGIVENYNSNLIGTGKTVTVVEADEFDRSFLHLHPNIACVTSMDADHLDIYGTSEEIEASFVEFANKVEDKSQLFITNELPIEGVTCAVNEEAVYKAFNVRVGNGSYVFDVQTPTETIRDIAFGLPGRHNLMNALMALAMAKTFGTSSDAIAKALASFKGIRRRFSYQIKTSNMVYIDDYAHHPTEIISVLNAIKSSFENKKIVTVFQPHRYSRVALLKKEFANAFIDSDLVVLCPIYAASEKPIKNINHYELAKLIKKNSKKEVICIENQFDLERFIKLHAYGNEIIVCMGAGSISSWIRDIAVNLKNEH